MENIRNQIEFYLNGIKQTVDLSHSTLTLSDYLRYEKCLTGTKVVCAEGDCGACTVLRYFPFPDEQSSFEPMNSCITPLLTLDGSSLVTVEALKGNDELHPVQTSMINCHGSQCGFCTPGFVMSLAGLVENKLVKNESTISKKEAKNWMTGNLCRCTGYEPIIHAALDIKLSECKSIKEKNLSSVQVKSLKDIFARPLKVEGSHFTLHAPKTMEEACQILRQNTETKIIAASTDLGVVHNKRKIKLTHLLSLHLIEELYEIKRTNSFISLGARVTIDRFRHFMRPILPEFSHYLDLFASPQIKNIATVIGNICNASPIGDLPTALLALDTQITLQSPKGERTIPLSDFFISYRKTARQNEEIAKSISFKIPDADHLFKIFKNSNRKDLDISAINFSLHASWNDASQSSLKKIMIAGGGLAATPIRFFKTEKFLESAPISKNLIIEAAKILQSEFEPLSDLRASSHYRRVVVNNYFKRFFHELNHPELKA